MQSYEGQYTNQIYSLIKDQNYTEAIRILYIQLEINPKNRAALSLLGYCNYLSKNFLAAAEMYEQLIKYYPEVAEYKIYLAQSLYKAENYIEALKACQNIDKPELSQQVIMLQFAIKYQMNELSNAHALLENSDPNKEETLVSQGCILYKENKFQEAMVKFEEAKKLCDSPFIEYNIGVCCYKLKMLTLACNCFRNILEHASKNYPEIMIQNRNDNFKSSSMANMPGLYESCLIEGYNLKAALEYMVQNIQESKEALAEMPSRDDEEIDSVTLHNLALVNIDKDPDDSFKKLNFLLKKPLCPPEALSNLLILYCKYEQFDLAYDVLSENEELKMKYMTEEEVAYITALGNMKNNKEVAYESLDKLAKVYRESISKQFKLIKDAKDSSDKEMFNKILQNYDNALQKFLPIITSQAKIYWDIGNFEAVEGLLKNPEIYDLYCDNRTWKINMGHAYFIQETNFNEAIKYYIDVYTNEEDVLNVPASVIANLCVSLIMVQRNEEAQEIIKKVEEEEIKALEANPDRLIFHVCIVNLIVGTLYCSKSNYEFGIGRVIVSFQNYHKRLNIDTWFYAKRCFLALIEAMAKQVMIIPDDLYKELMLFLDNSDKFGGNITTQMSQNENVEKCTVSTEARLLKRMFLRIKEVGNK